MAKWLVKSDPDAYSWDKFEKDRITDWDGVRNYQARNNLSEMIENDEVLFYHSNQDRAVIGTAFVSKEAFQDYTSDDQRWLAVGLSIGKKFLFPVTLERIKKNEKLANIALIKQSRLSVMPLSEEEFQTIVELSKTGE